jgi:soluble lytic murein transglycosylase-like protein
MMQNIISQNIKNRQMDDVKPSNLKNLLNQFSQNYKEITLHITSALGVVAIAFLVAMFFNPNLTQDFKQLSPFDKEIAIEESADELAINKPASLAMLMATPQLIANAKSSTSTVNIKDAINHQYIGTPEQQKLVTNWLSRRYRVANDAVNMLVSASYLAAQETKLDPLLILSVIAIESRFNPFSESPVGAQGLMQVMSKVHYDKFSEHGGIKAALNPVANIKVGSLILQDYIKRSGSVEGGLKRYVGAADMETDGGYGSLVLAEYKRLKAVAAGKNVSIYATTPKPVEIEKPENTTPVAKAEVKTVTNPLTISSPKLVADI